jgi:hypothetical protein
VQFDPHGNVATCRWGAHTVCLDFARDLNNDLQKHPFDDELAVMATSFALLMQDIVGTIDKYGLRAWQQENTVTPN